MSEQPSSEEVAIALYMAEPFDDMGAPLRWENLATTWKDKFRKEARAVLSSFNIRKNPLPPNMGERLVSALAASKNLANPTDEQLDKLAEPLSCANDTLYMLKWLASPEGERLGDFERINEFVKVGFEAAKEIERLRSQVERMTKALEWVRDTHDRRSPTHKVTSDALTSTERDRG